MAALSSSLLLKQSLPSLPLLDSRWTLLQGRVELRLDLDGYGFVCPDRACVLELHALPVVQSIGHVLLVLEASTYTGPHCDPIVESSLRLLRRSVHVLLVPPRGRLSQITDAHVSLRALGRFRLHQQLDLLVEHLGPPVELVHLWSPATVYLVGLGVCVSIVVTHLHNFHLLPLRFPVVLLRLQLTPRSARVEVLRHLEVVSLQNDALGCVAPRLLNFLSGTGAQLCSDELGRRELVRDQTLVARSYVHCFK